MPLAEVDRTASQYISIAIDAKARASVSVEKAQPILSDVIIDAMFADARNRSRSHQNWNLFRQNFKKIAKQFGVNFDLSVTNLDIHVALHL